MGVLCSIEQQVKMGRVITHTTCGVEFTRGESLSLKTELYNHQATEDLPEW